MRGGGAFVIKLFDLLAIDSGSVLGYNYVMETNSLHGMLWLCSSEHSYFGVCFVSVLQNRKPS